MDIREKDNIIETATRLFIDRFKFNLKFIYGNLELEKSEKAA